MDGIFGIGLPEMIIVALVLFMIGGPQNTTKWAREMGRQVRKLRAVWAEMSGQIEKELGPEGKELMDMSRELGRGAQELRNMTSPQRVLRETNRLIDPPASSKPASPVKSTSSNGGIDTISTSKKYPAWLPPDKPSK